MKQASYFTLNFQQPYFPVILSSFYTCARGDNQPGWNSPSQLGVHYTLKRVTLEQEPDLRVRNIGHGQK